MTPESAEIYVALEMNVLPLTELFATSISIRFFIVDDLVLGIRVHGTSHQQSQQQAVGDLQNDTPNGFRHPCSVPASSIGPPHLAVACDEVGKFHRQSQAEHSDAAQCPKEARAMALRLKGIPSQKGHAVEVPHQVLEVQGPQANNADEIACEPQGHRSTVVKPGCARPLPDAFAKKASWYPADLGKPQKYADVYRQQAKSEYPAVKNKFWKKAPVN